jgi:hypothetical protein
MLALIIDPTAATAPPEAPAAPFVAAAAPQGPIATSTTTLAAVSTGSNGEAVTATNQAPPSGVAASGAEIKLGFGLLPSLAAGLGTSLFVPLAPNWTVLLGATMWIPQRVDRIEGSSGAGFEMALASLGLCRRRRIDNSFGILLCAEAEPGIIVAQGYGFLADQSRSRFTLDLGVAPRVAVNFGGGVWAVAGGELVLPVRRDKFRSIDASGNARDIFQRPAVGGSLGIGLSVHLFP